MTLLAYAIKYIPEFPLFTVFQKVSAINHAKSFSTYGTILAAVRLHACMSRGDMTFSVCTFFSVIPVLKHYSVPVNCFSVFSR